jgi:hypothetical protein
LFTIALVVWELAQVVDTRVDLPFRTALLTVVLAGCVVLFTVMKLRRRRVPALAGLDLPDPRDRDRRRRLAAVAG